MKEVKKIVKWSFQEQREERSMQGKIFCFYEKHACFSQSKPTNLFLKAPRERRIFVSFIHCIKLFSGVILIMAGVNSLVIDLHEFKRKKYNFSVSEQSSSTLLCSYIMLKSGVQLAEFSCRD